MTDYNKEVRDGGSKIPSAQRGAEKARPSWKVQMKKQARAMNYKEGSKLLQMQDEKKEEGGAAKNLWDEKAAGGLAKAIDKYDIQKVFYEEIVKLVRKNLPENVDRGAEGREPLSNEQVAEIIADTIANRIMGGEYPELYEALESAKGDLSNWVRTHLSFGLQPVEHKPRERKKPKSEQEILDEKVAGMIAKMKKDPAEIEAEKKRWEEAQKLAAKEYDETILKVMNETTLEGKKRAWTEFAAKHASTDYADMARRYVAQFDKMIKDEILSKGVLTKDFSGILTTTLNWDERFVKKVGVKGRLEYETLDMHAILKGEVVLKTPFARDAALVAKGEAGLRLGQVDKHMRIAGSAEYEKKDPFKGGDDRLRMRAGLAGKYDNVSGEVYYMSEEDRKGRRDAIGGRLDVQLRKNLDLNITVEKGEKDTRGFVGISWRF
ncbi:MAG: hypothetical protein FJ088_07710 [Deltaproteobacteria bacterium]|nr:hypothetical protein [Deltaproteobacteria bacterium]